MLLLLMFLAVLDISLQFLTFLCIWFTMFELWFWPSTEKENQKLLGRDLWMIGRRSKLNKQDAYACVNCSDDVPTSPDLVWKCYEKSSGKWKDEQ